MEMKNLNSRKNASAKNPDFCSDNEQVNGRIRKIAQQLFEKRGKMPGRELDDWLEAEKIVKRECRVR